MKSGLRITSIFVLFAGAAFAFKAFAYERADVPQLCTAAAAHALEINFAEKHRPALRSENWKDIFDYIVSGKGCMNQMCELGIAPWLLFSFDASPMKKAGWELQREVATRFLKRVGTDDSLHDVLLNASFSEADYSAKALAHSRTILQRAHDGLPKAPHLSRLQLSMVCKLYPEYDRKQCIKDLRRLIEKMHTVGVYVDPKSVATLGDPSKTEPYLRTGFVYSLSSTISRIFTDPGYARGAAIAALKMIDRVDAMESGQEVTGDFYSDLYESYLAAGLSAEKSDDYAWDLLGLYGSRGASVDYLAPFATAESAGLMAAIYVITAAPSYLDTGLIGTGRAYSYPQNVRTTCDYGRTYHFWLPAYLSRWLVKSGSPSRSAALAAHIAGMGYEYGSTTLGRDPEKAFDKEIYSPYLNSIRINVAFNDAGAALGAHWNDEKTRSMGFDIDLGLTAILNNGKPAKNGFVSAFFSTNSVTRFFRWRKALAPDKAFEIWLNERKEAAR